MLNLDAIRGAGRGEDGKFLPGHQTNLKGGAQANHLLDVPEVGAAHKGLVDAILVDLGGRSEVPTVKLALVEELAAVMLMTATYRDKLFREGLQTAKGNTRASFTIYTGLLGHEMRLAGMVGLVRKVHEVRDLAAAFRSEQR